MASLLQNTEINRLTCDSRWPGLHARDACINHQHPHHQHQHQLNHFTVHPMQPPTQHNPHPKTSTTCKLIYVPASLVKVNRCVLAGGVLRDDVCVCPSSCLWYCCVRMCSPWLVPVLARGASGGPGLLKPKFVKSHVSTERWKTLQHWRVVLWRGY